MTGRWAWIKTWRDGIPPRLFNETRWMCHCYAAFTNPQAFDEHRRACGAPAPAGWYASVTDDDAHAR